MAIVATGEMAVTPDLKGFESKMTSSLGNIAKKAAVAFGGVFAAQKAFDFVGSAVKDARESNAIAAQTTAVIKSTGGAANVTAKEVDRLATAISNKTGVDDEQIAKASNLLLTFTGIKNAAGKNNDIFNQATKIAVDMGKALGTDAAGSAIQLGKALNDPVKGITALTRVGVTFSDAQKKQIEGFVKTGKVAEAQKVILAELNKEFGGSAEAQATAADKLKVTVGNLKEQLGNQLVPVMERAATFLADNLPKALDFAGRAFDRVKAFVEPLKNIIANLFGGFTGEGTEFVGDFDEGFYKLGQTIRDVYNNQIKPFAAFITGTVVPAFAMVIGKVGEFAAFLLRNIDTLKKVAVVIGTILIPHYVALGVQATISAGKQVAAWVLAKTQAIAATLVHSAQVVLQIGQWVALGVAATVNAAKIAAAWLISMGPIALVAAAVVGLVVVVVKNWDTIKNAIMTAATAVLNFLRENWDKILVILTGPFGLAVVAIVKNWDKIRDGGAAAFNAVKGAVEDVIGALKKAWEWVQKLIDRLGKLPGAGAIKGLVKGIPGVGLVAGLVPGFHDGGVYRAPFGSKEGLALLRDGETVLTPGQSAGNVFHVSVSFNGQVSEQQAYTTGVAVGKGIQDEMARTELRRAARAR